MPGDNLLIPLVLTLGGSLAVAVLLVGWTGVAVFLGFCALLWLLDALGFHV